MDTTTEQPQAQDKGISQTPADKEEIKEETYTKSQHTEAMLRETAKVKAAEAKKREKLEAELEALKRKDLPDPEKVKLELSEKDKKISEAEAKLASLEAREKKRNALDAAKLTLPADITLQDLLDMMPGNDDEAIEGYVQKFKKMFPASKGLGTSTTTGDKTTAPSIDDEISALHARLNDPKTGTRERVTIGQQLNTLAIRKISEKAKLGA